MASKRCLSWVLVAAIGLGGLTARAAEDATTLDPALDTALEAGIEQARQEAGAPNPDAIQLADAPQPAPTGQRAVAPTPVAARKAGNDDALFPRYALLKPNVAFWTQVFSTQSEHQSAIHDMQRLDIVFETLDFTGEASYLDPASLRKLKNAEEAKALARVRTLLDEVHALRHQPELLNVEQRRIFDLYAKVDDDLRFQNAAIRSQRGLRERTQQALEISGKYLPAMEAVFESYQLPLRLTRLPLVESSFNVEAYSKVGAAGLWQFIPASARIYMRLNNVVDDRRDPWTSTDAAARHLRDDYQMLGAWPLALTAYNHGRGGVARGLVQTGGTELPDLVRGYTAKSFGFASRNFYAEFLAAYDVERNWKKHFGEIQRKPLLEFDVVETKHYVPYETLRRLCEADDALFRKLNPAYRPEVIEGKLYVPPGHLIRVPAGAAKNFDVAYAQLGDHERFDAQRVNHLLHKVRRGETLSGVAKRYGVTQSSIRANNDIGKRGTLRSGQVLKIVPRSESRPGPVTVAVGESKPGLTRAEKRAADHEAAKPKRPTYRTHKVRSGQTLGSIAKLYKVSIRELRNANDMGSSSVIKVGEKLKVPTAR
jgi:membrane-bound lytic murein transglycosylase D